MKTWVRVIFILSLGLVAGCQKKAETTIQFQIPSAQELRGKQSKVKSQSTTVDPALLCFGVNVKGGNIKTTSDSCDIERGIFSGSVGPGGTLSLLVPVSTGLTFEVYGFLRSNSSDPCIPIQSGGGWNWPISNIYFLGKTADVTVEPSTQFVDVTIALPQPSDNIASTNHWGPSCAGGSNTAGNNIGRTALSATVSSGSLFKAYSRVSEKPENQILSGSQFQIHNWKASVH